MSELLLKVGASYLLGSLIGGLLVGRLRGGVDIRRLGSGNAGGTNALRTQGKGFAFWVLLIDVAKGWAATRLVGPLFVSGVSIAAPALRLWLPAACGIAAITGHVWPVWYGFRGGKGVATLLGAVLGLGAGLLIPMLIVWLLVAILIGFVSLASIAAAAALPAYLAFSGTEPRLPLLTFGVTAALMILFTHRANIARLRSGTEPRTRWLWLLGRGPS